MGKIATLTLSNIEKRNGILSAKVHIDYDKVPDFEIAITEGMDNVRNTRILKDEFLVAATVKLYLLNQDCVEKGTSLPQKYSVSIEFNMYLDYCNDWEAYRSTH